MYWGDSEFVGDFLYIEGVASVSEKNEFFILTVFDVDENEGIITLRYDGRATFPERKGKLRTFKRTNILNGKNFIGWQ
jgi:hypothetical protein